MTRSTNAAAVLAATVLLIVTSAAQAALNVDFGETSAPAAELEPAFRAFPLSNSSNYQGTFIDYGATGLDNGTPVRVTVDGTATATNAQRVVDRGDAGWTGGRNALLRDWIGIDARTGTPGTGTDTIVRLENLQPGLYSYRSYHTDISTGGNQSPTFDFLVNNSLMNDNFQVRGQVGAAPTTTPNFFDTTFVADGINPVELTYRLTPTTAGDKGFPVLNGFELNQVAQAGDFFRIDIDSTIVSGGPAQPVDTASGWTSLDATAGSGSSVVVDGTTFTVFSADGSRVRNNNPTPNALTRDFVFDDGAGQAVGLTIAGLEAGVWEASVWAWDDALPTTTGDQLVGLIEGVVGPSPETIIGSFSVDPTNPITTFRFEADGTSLYSIFTRENSDQDHARFNGLQLVRVQIPEPATGLLAAMGVAMLGLRRRRQA